MTKDILLLFIGVLLGFLLTPIWDLFIKVPFIRWYYRKFLTKCCRDTPASHELIDNDTKVKFSNGVVKPYSIIKALIRLDILESYLIEPLVGSIYPVYLDTAWKNKRKR